MLAICRRLSEEPRGSKWGYQGRSRFKDQALRNVDSVWADKISAYGRRKLAVSVAVGVFRKNGVTGDSRIRVAGVGRT